MFKPMFIVRESVYYFFLILIVLMQGVGFVTLDC